MKKILAFLFFLALSIQPAFADLVQCGSNGNFVNGTPVPNCPPILIDPGGSNVTVHSSSTTVHVETNGTSNSNVHVDPGTSQNSKQSTQTPTQQPTQPPTVMPTIIYKVIYRTVTPTSTLTPTPKPTTKPIVKAVKAMKVVKQPKQQDRSFWTRLFRFFHWF